MRRSSLSVGVLCLVLWAGQALADDFPQITGEWVCRNDFALYSTGFKDRGAHEERTLRVEEQKDHSFRGSYLWTREAEGEAERAAADDSGEAVPTITFREDFLGSFRPGSKEFLMVDVDDSGRGFGEVSDLDTLSYVYSAPGAEPVVLTLVCNRAQ